MGEWANAHGCVGKRPGVRGTLVPRGEQTGMRFMLTFRDPARGPAGRRAKTLAARLMIALCAVSMPTIAAAQTLIVGNKNEDTVSFIDLASGDERFRVETGRAPHEIAISPDGETAVVVSYRAPGFTGNSLHVFDIASGAQKAEISLGPSKAPHGLKWIPDTDQVIVTTELSEDVVIVDIPARAIVERIKTRQRGSHMVALAPGGATGYVSNIGSGSFTVLDLKRAQKLRDIRVGDGAEAIAVSPDGAEIWVGANVDARVTVFSAATLSRARSRDVDGVPIRIEISPDGRHAAVSLADRQRVDILDTENLETVASVDLAPHQGSTPVTMLFAPDGGRLWVAATQAARVIEIETGAWSVTRAIEAGAGADGLGFSALTLALPGAAH